MKFSLKWVKYHKKSLVFHILNFADPIFYYWENVFHLRKSRLRKAAGHFHRGLQLWKGGTGMYGEFEHTIDSKGRMNFPAKLREELGEHFYISKTIGESCLTVHTEQSWNDLRESLRGKPTKVRLPLERFLFGGACEVEPDKQGRIAIAPALRAYAGLTSEVVVVGMDDHAEIWDKAAYIAYTESVSAEDIAALAEEIGI